MISGRGERGRREGGSCMKFIVMQANNFGVHTKVAQIYEYNAGPRGKGGRGTRSLQQSAAKLSENVNKL